MSETVRKKYRYMRPKSTAEILNDDSFERMKAKKNRRSTMRKIFYAVVSLVVCLVFGILCVHFFFNAKTITLEGLSRYSAEDVLASTGIDVGRNLYSISESELENILIDKYPYISDVDIGRKLPDELILRITEDTPIFYTEIYGETFILGNDMRVLEAVETDERLEDCKNYLIKLTLPSPSRAVLGERIEFSPKSSYDYMMVIFDEMKNDGIYDRINSINASDKFGIYIIADDGRLKVTFGDNSDMAEKLKFMYAIMEKHIEENSVVSIDVSYTDSAFASYQDELFSD